MKKVLIVLISLIALSIPMIVFANENNDIMSLSKSSDLLSYVSGVNNVSDDATAQKYIYVYQRLRTCATTTYKEPMGYIHIQSNKNGTCNYVQSMNGNVFECNFPMESAQRYSFLKRKARWSKENFNELRELESRYCQSR